jgi:hypothetical protein
MPEHGPPNDYWERYKERRMSSEEFEMLLVSIRNGVSSAFRGLAFDTVKTGAKTENKREDAIRVWHATEIALGMLLFPRYVPKPEALADVRSLLALYAADEADEGYSADDVNEYAERLMTTHGNATRDDVNDLAVLHMLAGHVSMSQAAAASILWRMMHRHTADSVGDLVAAGILSDEDLQALEELGGAMG